MVGSQNSVTEYMKHGTVSAIVQDYPKPTLIPRHMTHDHKLSICDNIPKNNFSESQNNRQDTSESERSNGCKEKPRTVKIVSSKGSTVRPCMRAREQVTTTKTQARFALEGVSQPFFVLPVSTDLIPSHHVDSNDLCNKSHKSHESLSEGIKGPSVASRPSQLHQPTYPTLCNRQDQQ